MYLYDGIFLLLPPIRPDIINRLETNICVLRDVDGSHRTETELT